TGGINVFFSGEGDLEVDPGDEHILYGTISSFSGQVQISVDSAEVVSTGNDVFVTEIEFSEFLDVESPFQGSYVQLQETATYLADISDWPVDGFSWSGSGTNVYFEVLGDTLTYRIDRDEAFYDGTVEPEDGAEFILSGILSRFNEDPQLFGGFFDDDIVEVGGDLVTNGDFEAGDDGSWYGSGLDIRTEEGNSYNFVDVTNAGTAFSVNLSQNVDLIPGAYYELTFDAATGSGNTRDMVVGIGLSQAPFYAATETVTLTEEEQTYTVGVFATDDATGNDFGVETSRVLFDMGADVGIVVLDNVSLELAEEPMEITPIGDARALQDSSVAITGITSTPNYGFNNGQWFIEDETGGINVFFSGEGDLEVDPGDEHILYG
ncbi:MAG: carbohydrate binding domain-containing protein, partial [Gracilimonas sp.]|nr:carbohydrate binding domain-containing protein [Gracilimonas sp.]